MNELTDIAIIAYRAQRYAEALALLEQVYYSDEPNRLAQVYLALAYEKCGRLEDAKIMFNLLSAAVVVDERKEVAWLHRQQVRQRLHVYTR